MNAGSSRNGIAARINALNAPSKKYPKDVRGLILHHFARLIRCIQLEVAATGIGSACSSSPDRASIADRDRSEWH
jgi:hypothetical protein